MKKGCLVTLAVIAGVIIVAIGSIRVMNEIYDKDAVRTAAEYVEATYQQKMVFLESKRGGMDSKGWYVYFSPENNPEVKFYVRVVKSSKFLKTEVRGDTYYSEYIASQLETELNPLVRKVWEDIVDIHVELSFGLDYYNFGDIDEFTNFLTMKDKFFQGYSLTVDLKEVSKSRYQIAGEVFEFVQMLKAHNFEPSEIFFSVLFNEESERTLFSIFDLENVNSVENIFALIEEWG